MVDLAARISLASLAQMSEVGYVAGNSIITKLLKRVAQGEVLDGPSAFVMKSCQNAKQSLDW